MCAIASALLVWRARIETERALLLASENHGRAEEHLKDARCAVDNLFTGVAGDLAEVPGAENVRHELLDQALAYYQKFAAQGASDPAVCAETASAHYRCGQISEQLGDDAAAYAAYEQASRLWSALRAERPEHELLRPLGLCENNLGLIEFRRGRHPQAEAHLRKAMELQRKLTIDKPGEAEARRALALSYANLGMVLGQEKKTDEARQYLQQAIELQAADPAPSALARGDRASTYNQLGYLHSSSSAVEAETAYRRGRRIRTAGQGRAERLALAGPTGNHAQ